MAAPAEIRKPSFLLEEWRASQGQPRVRQDGCLLTRCCAEKHLEPCLCLATIRLRRMSRGKGTVSGGGRAPGPIFDRNTAATHGSPAIQVQGGLGMFQRLWVRHCLRLQRGAIVPSSLFGGSLIWLEGLGWLNALAKVAHVRGPGVDDVRELESRHDEEGLPSAVLWF